jgi:hypothetical protein
MEVNLMDEDIVDGEVLEPEEHTKSDLSTGKGANQDIIRMPAPPSTVDAQPANVDDGDSSGGVRELSSDHDWSPLLKARAQEFTRRHEAMTRAYEQVMFGALTDAMESMHQPLEEEPTSTPIGAWLVASCGDALVQAGHWLVHVVEPSRSATEAPGSSLPLDGPTVIVLTEDGGFDD